MYMRAVQAVRAFKLNSGRLATLAVRDVSIYVLYILSECSTQQLQGSRVTFGSICVFVQRCGLPVIWWLRLGPLLAS